MNKKTIAAMLFLTMCANFQNVFASSKTESECNTQTVDQEMILSQESNPLENDQEQVRRQHSEKRTQRRRSSGISESPISWFQKIPGSWEESFDSPLRQESSQGEWEDFASESFNGGDGLTEETAFEIDDAEQLALLSVKTNFPSEDDKGKFYFYKLVNDIDLENHFWDAIGINSNKFYGCFDGNGHTIKNLKIYKDSESGQGLFGYVQEHSMIKNVTISNFYVSADFYIGAVVGQGHNIDIQNCNVFNGNSIGEYNFVGSIIGDATKSRICNCKVRCVTATGDFLVGRFCGNQNNVIVINCNGYLVSQSQKNDLL